MTQEFANPKEGFRQLTIIHIALTLGLIFMFCFLWFFIGTIASESDADNMIGMVVPLVVLGAIWASWMFYNFRKKQGAALKEVETKLIHYRMTCIVRWAMVEGACLISIMFYFFVLPHQLILIGFAIGLGALVFFRPSVEGFSTDYKLSSQETFELK